MKPIPTIDGHHHIWRLKDLSWLSGPQVPRIFGPYQPICRDYTIEEFRSEVAACDVVRSVYVQTNWPAGQSLDEARWVQSVADATGWPHANVAHADLADPDVGTLLKQLKDLPATRGIRQQLHWHDNPQYSFALRPDVFNDSEWRRGLAMLSDHGLLFELQVFASQMADGARLARCFPDTTFVLEHAGMLEDTSKDGWKRWRDGMAALADCSNVNVKLSGLGTFDHAYRLETVAPIVRETIALFGADRCLFGSNFPIEKLWTDYASLYGTFRQAIEHLPEGGQHDVLYNTAARLYRI
ncbi:amidohydrolase family protein [Tardiphaga sp. vice154]|uniref:amidohydrolase family protein n=1 Tax=Tardiphaga sp. vice154 TaxID=2592814 RepID=UPI00116558D8|nr:amidohydrolase family protein [Tardiphaga sp. vice154]QDM22677.1 amidohydrolase family protein [Tardiphaga sp. vice154]